MTVPERYTGRSVGRSPDFTANPQVSGRAVGGWIQDVFHVLTTDPGAGLAAGLVRMRNQLSDRDLAVLHALAALRLMTANQVRRLIFNTGSAHTQARRASQTLQRLHSLGLVTRVDRHIGGPRAGSTSYTYHLSDQGQRLVGARPTRPQRFLGTRDHTLTVTELGVTLHEAHQTGTLELAHFAAEPTCWRSFTLDGARRYIRPDAFLIVAVGEWERLWFIELDRGTQSVSTVRRKAHAYRAYATCGQEQTRWGVFPRVAYLTTTPQRRNALAHALARTPDADALVTVAHLPDATATLATTKHEHREAG